MITISGVGSGLDIDGIVTGLMEIEREPVRRLEARRDRLDVELSAFASARSLMGELAAAADTLGDGAKLAPPLSSSSDEGVFTATADASAGTERHDVEVLSLASAHRVATEAHASADAAVGPGTWRFASGENAFEVTLADGEDSVAALHDAINGAPENDSVTASLLEVDGGTRLVLTALRTGTDNAIVAERAREGSFGGVVGGGTENPFEEVAAPTDATLLVDGFEVTRPTNSIADVVEGVTLELHDTGTARLDTRRDVEAMDAALEELVSKYNALHGELEKLGEGTLSGDRLPRNVDTELRRAFSTDVELGDGSAVAPVELGFTFDRHGTLSLDRAALAERRQEGVERLVEAYSRPVQGFAARLSQVLEHYTGAEGRIASREGGIESRRDTLDTMIERQEYRMEVVEARYRRQFGAMDQLVGSLQGTSNLLLDRLGD